MYFLEALADLCRDGAVGDEDIMIRQVMGNAMPRKEAVLYVVPMRAGKIIHSDLFGCGMYVGCTVGSQQGTTRRRRMEVRWLWREGQGQKCSLLRQSKKDVELQEQL